jgi:hypothetical protein
MSPSEPKLPLFEDADETVRAIHQGDIDAVVVMRALEGPQVILLHGAEEPYRVLVLHRALPDLQRMKLCYSAAASSASRSVFSWCD